MDIVMLWNIASTRAASAIISAMSSGESEQSFEPGSMWSRSKTAVDMTQTFPLKTQSPDARPSRPSPQIGNVRGNRI